MPKRKVITIKPTNELKNRYPRQEADTAVLLSCTSFLSPNRSITKPAGILANSVPAPRAARSEPKDNSEIPSLMAYKGNDKVIRPLTKATRNTDR